MAQPKTLVVMTKSPPKRLFQGTRDGVTRQFATEKQAGEYAFNSGGNPVKKTASIVLAAALLAGCATEPMGPQIAVMPGRGKTLEAFAQDNALCTHYAQAQVQGEAEKANGTQLLATVGGGLLGAGVGALFGGGHGAALGAGAGLLAGTAAGGMGASHAGMTLQDRYDVAFAQCMTTRGNRVPLMMGHAR